jgi:fucose permease
MNRRDLPKDLIANGAGTVLFTLAWATSAIVAMRHAGFLGDSSQMDHYEKLRYQTGIWDFVAIAIGVWFVHAITVALARIRWPMSKPLFLLVSEVVAGVTTWALGHLLDRVGVNGLGVFVTTICVITALTVALDDRLADRYREYQTLRNVDK